MLNFIQPAQAQIITNTAQDAITEFKIAENYFSDILNAQIVIFSVIIAAIITLIVGLYFYFQPRISKTQIEEEVKKETKKIREVLNGVLEKSIKEIKEENEKFTKGILKELNLRDTKIINLQGSVYRVFGRFFENERHYSTSFIWWIRSASEYFKTKQDKLVRIALDSARTVAEQIEPPDYLSSDVKGEYQKILNLIKDEVYKVEKEQLIKAVKDAIERTKS